MKKIDRRKIRDIALAINVFLSAGYSLGVSAENSKTIEELFMNSLIADAAYVSFDSNSLAAGLEGNDNWKLEPKRIEMVTKNFELLDFQPDTNSGFSGGLFRRLKGENAGRTIYASRGTTGLLDDIVEADVYGIAAMGVPQFQVRDLYNYVQRLKAPRFGEYTYLKDTLFGEFYLEFGTKTDGQVLV